MKYKAILFDLFDTLIHFDFKRSPIYPEAGPQPFQSVLYHSYLAFATEIPEVDFPRYGAAVATAFQPWRQAKNDSLREISAEDRFASAVDQLQLGDHPNAEAARKAAMRAHFSLILDGVYQPEAYRPFLKALAEKVPVGLVSNYDYSPSAWAILDKFNMRNLFTTVVISMDVGWRKPDVRLFDEAHRALGFHPEEILFVGDTPLADVSGAKDAGMDAAWVRRNGAVFPDDLPQPDYTVESILGLAGLFGIPAGDSAS